LQIPFLVPLLIGTTDQARNQLGTPGGANSFEGSPKLLKFVQQFPIVSNTFFPGGAKTFLRGASPPLLPLVTELPQILTNAHWASTTVQVVPVVDHVRTILVALYALA